MMKIFTVFLSIFYIFSYLNSGYFSYDSKSDDYVISRPFYFTNLSINKKTRKNSTVNKMSQYLNKYTLVYAKTNFLSGIFLKVADKTSLFAHFLQNLPLYPIPPPAFYSL